MLKQESVQSGAEIRRIGAAIVIGGSGGLGGPICLALARTGFHIALSYKANKNKADRVSEQVMAMGMKALTGQVSLEEIETIARLAKNTIAELGSIDTVVYASGPGTVHIEQDYVINIGPEKWRSFMDADTNGFFNLMHVTLPFLRQSRGSVVALSTTAVRRTVKRNAASAVPKAGVEALIRAIAKEEGRFGVRANGVAPGMIESELAHQVLNNLPPAALNAFRKETALNRFGRPEEVAEVVAFLASKLSSYVTGQLISADGGYAI